MRPPESFVEQPVRSLQTMLRVIAEDDKSLPTVIPDGIYGPTTANAVTMFQRREGIPATGNVETEGITDQATQVMKNLAAVHEEAGTKFENVVKTTCFLADMGDFAAFNAVYAQYFTSNPARSCVAVKTLPRNVLVEVEVVAVID